MNTYSITDNLYGSIRGIPSECIKAINGKSDYAACINEVYRLSELLGFDASIPVSQMVVETAGFTSSLWVDTGNPGGIGIDGTNSTDSVNTGAIKSLNGTQAAQAHLLTLYIKTKSSEAAFQGYQVITPPDLIDIEKLLPIWFTHTRLMCSDPNFPAIKTIDDLNIHFHSNITGNEESTWAWDATYQDQIVAQATKIFTGESNMTELIFGQVPHPAYTDRLVLDSESGAWDNIGQKTVDGVVWHRMEGTLLGTDEWFRRGIGVSDGLTEYGIGNLVTDGSANDGKIYRWNDPLGIAHNGVSTNRAPWASGPVSSPYGDGLAFLNDHNGDVNIVNRNQAAIEISGQYADAVSQSAQNSIVALTAYWADQAKIPWNQFPIINGKDYSFVRWHQEFTIGSGKVCPGATVMNLTNQLIADIAALMKKYQVAPIVTVPPVKPPVVTVPPKPSVVYVKAGPIPVADGFDKITKAGTFFHACIKNVTITAVTAPCHSYPDPNSGLTRSALVKGQTFATQWVQNGTDGKPWWVTSHGTRISTDNTDGWPLI